MLSDCNTVNLGTEQNRIEQDSTGQNRKEQKRAEQYSTVQNCTERDGPGSDSSAPIQLFDLTQNIKTEKQSQIRNPKKEMK